jgi:hypothetical protein
MRRVDPLFLLEGGLATPEVSPEAAWVAAGLGRASMLWDGVPYLLWDGALFRMVDLKKGARQPEGWVRDGESPTGLRRGWAYADQEDPNHVALAEAVRRKIEQHRAHPNLGDPTNGTYELVGPEIKGNPHGFDGHYLLQHGALAILRAPRDYEGLGAFLADFDGKGIAWSRVDEDGATHLVKVTRADFGLPWPIPAEEAAA